jgi:hypothetical protein
MPNITKINEVAPLHSVRVSAPKFTATERKEIGAIRAELDAADEKIHALENISEVLRDSAGQFARGEIDLAAAVAFAGQENTSANRHNIARPLRSAVKVHIKTICERARPNVEKFLDHRAGELTAKASALRSAELTTAAELGLDFEASGTLDRLEETARRASDESALIRRHPVSRAMVNQMLSAIDGPAPSRAACVVAESFREGLRPPVDDLDEAIDEAIEA